MSVKKSFSVAADNVAYKTRSRRLRRRAGDAPAPSDSIWLVSFTDVMALMLTFFVLLFSMSNPDQVKFEQLTRNISQNLAQFEGATRSRGGEDAITIGGARFEQALSPDYLQALFSKMLAETPELQGGELYNHSGQLVISLPNDMLFTAGSAQLQGGAKQKLEEIVAILRRINNYIEIVGHTDPRAVSGRFTSNWQLSLTRAASVSAAMREMGYDREVTLRAYADGRYQELPSTMPVEERLARARRVDIIVRPDTGTRGRMLNFGNLFGG